jgi:hypothetical protein
MDIPPDKMLDRRKGRCISFLDTGLYQCCQLRNTSRNPLLHRHRRDHHGTALANHTSVQPVSDAESYSEDDLEDPPTGTASTTKYRPDRNNSQGSLFPVKRSLEG